MPAYFRTTSGGQASWTVSDLAEALGVSVDAGIMRAAYADTWTAEGDGLPMPMEVSATVPIAAANASAVAAQLYALSQEGITAIGYESPLGPDSALEWERPVLAVRRLEVREGSARHAFVRMGFLVAPQVVRLDYLAAENGDELATEADEELLTEEVV